MLGVGLVLRNSIGYLVSQEVAFIALQNHLALEQFFSLLMMSNIC